MMIVSFKSKSTEDIFNGESTKEARRACPKDLWKVAVRKLDQLNAVTNLNDLKVPPGNFLETLLGNRKGQYSIRVNQQYRICFMWTDAGPEQVEILDYH
jgi:toxin HigB-1